MGERDFRGSSAVRIHHASRWRLPRFGAHCPLRFEHLEQRAMLCLVPIQSGPIINEASGHTYYLQEVSTWTEAEATAMDLGGNLVTINAAAEQAWVRATFGDSNQF